MALNIAPLTEAQVEASARLNLEAFKESVVSASVMPKGYTPAVVEYWIRDEFHDFEKGKRGFHMLVVTDSETDAVITAAHWRLEDDMTFKEVREDDKDLPEDFNKAALEDFFTMIEKRRKAIMGDKKYWHLKRLATNPTEQRRGGATLALQWGIQQADEAGLECYLDATIMGKPLYERWGFEVVDSSPFNAQKYGVNRPYTSYHMVRRPKRT